MAIPELPNNVSGDMPRNERLLTKQGLDLSMYSPDDLLDLRSRIDQLMPVRRLKDVNMETELVLQLQAVQRLQNTVIADDDTPANQRAQTAGAVASVLATLGKLQNEIYSSERLKQIELILIETLNTLPTQAQEEFFEKYERQLGATYG